MPSASSTRPLAIIMVPRSAPQHTSTDSGLAWLLHLIAAAAAVVLIKSPGPDATCEERAREHEGRRGVSAQATNLPV